MCNVYPIFRDLRQFLLIVTLTLKSSAIHIVVCSYMYILQGTGCPKKVYHICFAHSFHTFLRSLLKHTSKDSQNHGDLLTPPPDSVTCSWRSRCHVLEVGVPDKCTTFKSGISQKLCT